MGDVFLGIRYFNDAAIGDGSTYNTFWTVALQYWANSFIWLKGGVGIANLQINDENTPGVTINFDDETGLGIMGAVGFEVLQSYNFALDLQLRASHGFYAGGDLNNLAFMGGFTYTFGCR